MLAMTGLEEKRETGASLILVGLAVWVVDFLVVFFLPSGIKLGPLCDVPRHHHHDGRTRPRSADHRL